jgi:transposase
VDIDLAALPCDVDTLHQLVRDLAAQVADDRSELAQAQAEIERLELIIRRFQRAQFGRRSERIDGDQLALGLEDLDADIARLQARHPSASAHEAGSQPTSHRQGLPDHLPREDVAIDIDERVCPCCGGALHVIGETVSEMLDFVPARLRVLRIRRPKYGCRACGTIHQAAAPERPIAKGMASPALLAHVLVSKYCDHTPLYRQSQIFARHGVEIERSTLANWVGGACWWLEPLQARLAAHVFGSGKIFADDTTIPVLDPGRGRTKTGRLWVYTRDDRPWSGPDPPAAVYFYSPDRKAERPASHLETFRGVLQVDGYAGFERLTERGDIVLAACWAHTRRKFFDVHESTARFGSFAADWPHTRRVRFTSDRSDLAPLPHQPYWQRHQHRGVAATTVGRLHDCLWRPICNVCCKSACPVRFPHGLTSWSLKPTGCKSTTTSAICSWKRRSPGSAFHFGNIAVARHQIMYHDLRMEIAATLAPFSDLLHAKFLKFFVSLSGNSFLFSRRQLSRLNKATRCAGGSMIISIPNCRDSHNSGRMCLRTFC